MTSYRDDFFPGGGVFWCRGNLIRRLLDLKLALHDFEHDALPGDTTLADAVERILPAVAALDGHASEEFVMDDRHVGETPVPPSTKAIDHLFLDHNLGGGTRVFMHHTVNTLLNKGETIHRLFYDPVNKQFILHFADVADGGMLSFPTLDAVQAFFISRHVKRIVVNSFVQFPSPGDCISLIEELKRVHGSAVVYNTHDFYALCPSQHLLDHTHHFCGIPQDLAVCNCCAGQNSNISPMYRLHFNIVKWRRSFQKLFALCDALHVFDESSIGIMRRALQLPNDILRVTPHARPVALTPVCHPPGSKLCIGLIGTLTTCKGADRANALANHISTYRLNTPVLLVGTSTVPIADNIVTIGPYETRDLPHIILKHGITIFFISSIVPETFCYTLDELIAMEIPVVSFAIGAQGRRTDAYTNGITLALDVPVQDIYDALTALHKRCYGA